MCVCMCVCVLFLDESIDVVLCSVLIVGHLEHARHTQQGLLSVSVAHNLNTHTQIKRFAVKYVFTYTKKEKKNIHLFQV